MMTFVLSLTIELYVPCYCASRVTEVSDYLPRRIFYSNWFAQSREFKSSMILFLERAKQPIVPMAGGLFEIGLPIFVSVE